MRIMLSTGVQMKPSSYIEVDHFPTLGDETNTEKIHINRNHIACVKKHNSRCSVFMTNGEEIRIPLDQNVIDKLMND